jgi:hypothetical protein
MGNYDPIQSELADSPGGLMGRRNTQLRPTFIETKAKYAG